MGRSAMDAADLKFFAAVAKVGGMNRAASKLNTVQSNVTARVRTLEEELGVALFHRGHNGVTLTAAGERLLPYAIKVTHLLDEARKAVKDDGEPRGRLTIGSLETNAALRLLPVIASYSQAYPDVDLVLRSGTTHELIAQVLDHTVEGAFVCGPVDHQDLIEEVFFREELVVLTARTIRSLDEVTRKGDVKIVVHHQGCAYRQILENILIKRGVVGIRHTSSSVRLKPFIAPSAPVSASRCCRGASSARCGGITRSAFTSCPRPQRAEGILEAGATYSAANARGRIGQALAERPRYLPIRSHHHLISFQAESSALYIGGMKSRR